MRVDTGRSVLTPERRACALFLKCETVLIVADWFEGPCVNLPHETCIKVATWS